MAAMNRSGSSDAAVPNSRLFILGGKGLDKDDWHSAFQEFGEIQDVWIVKDRNTGDDKGVTYVTFSKASEAFLAQEKMNGEKVCGVNKPLKIMIASERREGCQRDQHEDEQHLRIFIKISRKTTREDLEAEFSQWGEIDNITILKDRQSGESKGLAYVRYFRSYHAALALESCSSTYRAVFASRRPTSSSSSSSSSQPRFEGSNGGGYDARPPVAMGGGPVDMLNSFSSGSGETRLEIMTPSMLSQEQLHRLLDLVPGLEYCTLDRRSGIAYVRYMNAQCAAYAKEKLCGFEYPMGHRLGVRYPPMNTDSGRSRFGGQDVYSGGADGSSRLSDNSDIQDNLQQLVATIQQATSALQAAGLNANDLSGFSTGSGGSNDGSVRVNYCNIRLPDTKPLVSKDNLVAERLFVVSQPEAFPEHLLRDCLCRFGNLIDCYFMPGKNYGYAKFATKESARECMDMLHGQTVCNQRIKIIKADPPKYNENRDGDQGRDYDDSSHKKLKS